MPALTEKKRAWTPGPWHYERVPHRFGDYEVSYTEIEGITGPVAYVQGKSTEANAALIAAAPEMYQALEAAVQNCPCSVRERDSGHRLECFAIQAIEALAKARGEVR